ncbi:CHRD domain-containing protein [soil metagenome]
MKAKAETNLSFSLSALFISLLLLSASCEKEDPAPSPEEMFSNIAITGAQEAPNPVTTNASGTFNGTFNKNTKILTYTISYSGITPTAMHFHKGAPGTAPASNVVLPITTAPSPISSSTPALTAEQEADLVAGNWYVNIHSQANPGGEIRGQLIRSN